MKIKIVLSLFLAIFLYMPTVGWASDFDAIVVFGDSLSDNGNFYALYPLWVPEEYYYQGRFSNGPVWVEYMAGEDFLDCSLFDNAYAGATTDGVIPPGLLSQVNTYVSSGSIMDNTLFIIWIGANDFLNGGVDYEASVNNIEVALDELAAFGVVSVLIINLPDLGATPRYVGTQDESIFRELSTNFNAALAERINGFRTEHPGITIYEFDSYSLLQDIFDNPADYGFTNVRDVCPSFYVADNFDNGDGYVFWNQIHPTTEAHEELAIQILATLSESNDDTNNSHASCFILTTFSIDY